MAAHNARETAAAYRKIGGAALPTVSRARGSPATKSRVAATPTYATATAFPISPKAIGKGRAAEVSGGRRGRLTSATCLEVAVSHR